MLIALHKNATTTPAIREAIQNAAGSDYALARQFRTRSESGADAIRSRTAATRRIACKRR